MSNTVNDPPPSYATRENDAARISQCADNVLALDKLYQDLTLAVLRAVKDPAAEKLAKDVQEVYSGYLVNVRKVSTDFESYVLRYIDYIIPMVLGKDYTPEEKIAELEVFLKITQPSIPEVPKELATGAESVLAKALEFIQQSLKDLDAKINKLTTEKEAETKKQADLEKELEKTPFWEYKKREALKKDIADVKKQLEENQAALDHAEEEKKKYLDAASPISDITKKISIALAKGPQELKSALSDVFPSIHLNTSKILKSLQDGATIDKDALEKQSLGYRNIVAALKHLATDT